MGEGSYGALGVQFYLDDTEARKAVRNFGNTIEKQQGAFDRFLDKIVPVAREAGKVTKMALDMPRRTANAVNPVRGAGKLGSYGAGIAAGVMFGDTALLQQQLTDLNKVVIATSGSSNSLQREVLDLRAALNITTTESVEGIAALSQYGRTFTDNGVLMNDYSRNVLKDAIKMQKAWGVSMEDGIQLHESLRISVGKDFKANKKYIESMRGIAEATGVSLSRLSALRKEMEELSMFMNDSKTRASFTESGMLAGAQLERYGIDAANWTEKLAKSQNPMTYGENASMLSMMDIAPGDPKVAEDMLGTLRRGAKLLENYSNSQKLIMGFTTRELYDLEKLTELRDEDFKIIQKQISLDKDWNKARGTLIESSLRLGNAFRDIYREAIMPFVKIMSGFINVLADAAEALAKLMNIISKYTFGIGPVFVVLIVQLITLMTALNLSVLPVKLAFKGLSMVLLELGTIFPMVAKGTNMLSVAMLGLGKFTTAGLTLLSGFYGSVMKNFIEVTRFVTKTTLSVVKGNPIIQLILAAIIIIGVLETKLHMFSKLFENIGNWFTKAFAPMAPFIDKATRSLGFLIPMLIAAGMAFTLGFGPIGAVISGITAGIIWFIENWDNMTSSVQNGIKQMGDGFVKLAVGLGQVFMGILKMSFAWIAPMSHIIKGMGAVMAQDWDGAKREFGMVMGSGIAAQLSGVKDIVAGMQKAFGGGVQIAKGGYNTIAGAVKDGVLKADKAKALPDASAFLQNITGMYSGQQVAYVDKNGNLTTPAAKGGSGVPLSKVNNTPTTTTDAQNKLNATFQANLLASSQRVEKHTQNTTTAVIEGNKGIKEVSIRNLRGGRPMGRMTEYETAYSGFSSMSGAGFFSNAADRLYDFVTGAASTPFHSFLSVFNK